MKFNLENLLNFYFCISVSVHIAQPNVLWKYKTVLQYTSEK